MRNKTILIFTLLILVSGALVLVLINSGFLRSKPTIRSIDKQVIYAGRKKPMLDQAPDEESQFSKTVKALDEGWDNIELGNSYKRVGQYEEAIQAYKKAYEIDPGNRILAGRLVVEAYEKLSQYDEAISMVDEILKTQPLGEYGVKKYSAMRSRLLAAKSQSPQTQPAQSS